MNKVFGLDVKVWTIILALAQFASIGLMIGAVCHDYWFHMKAESYDGTFKFKGGLFKPKSGIDCDSYIQCYYYACFTHCTQWRIWIVSGIVYASIDLFAAIFSFITGLLLLLNLFKIRYCGKLPSIGGAFWFMLIVFIIHATAFITWAKMVKLTFDDCPDYLDPDKTKNVCAEGGAIFSMIILIYLFLLTVFHFILSRKTAHQEREQFSELISRN